MQSQGCTTSSPKCFPTTPYNYSRLSHNCRQASIPTATSAVWHTGWPFDPTRWSFPTTGPRGGMAVWGLHGNRTSISLQDVTARQRGPVSVPVLVPSRRTHIDPDVLPSLPAFAPHP